MKVAEMPILIGELDTVTKELVQGLEDLEISGRVEIDQNTKNLGNLRKLEETCCKSDSVENHQLTLV